MFVRDVMTSDVVTVRSGTTLREATARLLEREVGSLVVVDDGTPAGFLTRTDVLRAACETGKRLEEIPVDVAEGDPPATATPSDTVQSTARRLVERGTKKALVVDGVDVVGVVTLTDVVAHLPEIRDEVRSAQSTRDEWTD